MSISYGTEVSGNVLTCLHEAGLDYQVAATPVLFKPENDTDEVEETGEFPYKYVTYRTDTHQPFGVVGSRYRIIQNDTLYSFLDYVSDFQITNAGSLRGGGWLCGKFPEQDVLGEVFAPYVFFSNSHDGTSQFIVAFTPYRVATKSFVNLGNASYRFSVRHTTFSQHKIRIAQRFVQQSAQAMDDFRSLVTETSAKRCPIDVAKQIFEQVLLCTLREQGKPPKTFGIDLQCLVDIFLSSQNSKYAFTGYGVLLAVSQFLEDVYRLRIRSEEGYLRKSLFRGNPMLLEAYRLVSAL